ncbi:uncharacterized protein LOC113233795 isoform X2 [Hyposmocoma kahamanoa]|uniref:uncharacterized protein LOC113233795 isoform X2 n=1 Tax=Hyposmocoma kahamanoa TaxID=1477025 RepID=UPI000E6D99E9|nr:uncharacterized protein LOC113233795 isoform X2 [Hyposmocoma kahamanoa]
MIQVILYLLLAANLIEDTVSATFHDFMKHFPEKMADAFKSSWRVITQGSSELKRTSPPRGLTEGPLWIKIPKRDGSKKPQKTRIDGAEPLKSQVINFRETGRSSSLQDVTEWFSTLVSPKINNKKHRTDGRRINQEPETKLRIPFFTPPKPNYKYLMRTVLWRTPRDAEIERMATTDSIELTPNGWPALSTYQFLP